MQLFFQSEITEKDTQVFFDKEESKHIVKVLRKSTRDVLHITNGKGWLFNARIISADLKSCVAEIFEKIEHSPRKYQLHLAVAPTKMNDRFEWFLEKATEIGIDEITPIICDHSERKVVKMDRFEKVIQSATKQSLSFFMPILNEPISYQEFIEKPLDGQKFIAHCEETDKKSLKDTLKSKHKVTILIGPEGDFSVNEIEKAIQNKYIPVTLGESRLRTETAAIVACHSVAFVNE